jgi:hypothetical protein
MQRMPTTHDEMFDDAGGALRGGHPQTQRCSSNKGMCLPRIILSFGMREWGEGGPACKDTGAVTGSIEISSHRLLTAKDASNLPRMKEDGMFLSVRFLCHQMLPSTVGFFFRTKKMSWFTVRGSVHDDLVLGPCC